MQDWAYDEEGQLILAGLLCLDVSEVRTFDPPRLMKCHGSGGSQQWSLGVRHTVLTVWVGFTVIRRRSQCHVSFCVSCRSPTGSTRSPSVSVLQLSPSQ